METSTFTLRAPTDEDLGGIVALQALDDERAGDSWITAAEDVRHEWSARGFDRERMVRVAEANGTIVGQFTINPASDGSARSHGFVHPDHRGRGIGSSLVGWAVDSARQLGIRELFTHSNDEDAVPVFEQAGFTYARTFIRMMNRDPNGTAKPEWPEGVRLAPLEGDALVDAMVAALDGSFIDHWNFRPTDRDEIVHELEHEGEDPSLWLVAFGDGQVAGCNVCRLKAGPDDIVRGWIGPLGTTRPFRGIGLGRALLRHGVHELAARGAVEVGLGVDAENPSKAVGLYERNGFARVSELRVFSRAL
jgi:mycothiol synthase